MTTHRRGPRFRAILAVAVLAVCTPAVPLGPPAAAQPPAGSVDYRVDPEGTGTVVGDDLAPDLTPARSARLGATGYPLIVGSDVLAITQVGHAATVHDLSLADGSFRWRTALTSAPGAQLAYGDGVVVVASADAVVGLDVADGH